MEEEELKVSALSMTMKTLIERSNPLPDLRELILRRSLLKIERNPERKKEERKKGRKEGRKEERKNEPIAVANTMQK